MSKSKAKGSGYERELVKEICNVGLYAIKAWGSNGKALGKPECVDVVIAHKTGDICVQAKRRAKLPEYLQIPDGCDVVVCRQDHGESMVLMRLSDYLKGLV